MTPAQEVTRVEADQARARPATAARQRPVAPDQGAPPHLAA